MKLSCRSWNSGSSWSTRTSTESSTEWSTRTSITESRKGWSTRTSNTESSKGWSDPSLIPCPSPGTGRDWHCFCERTTFLKIKKILVNDRVFQRKLNDGRTPCIIPRNKKLRHFENERKNKQNCLKLFKRTKKNYCFLLNKQIF